MLKLAAELDAVAIWDLDGFDLFTRSGDVGYAIGAAGEIDVQTHAAMTGFAADGIDLRDLLTQLHELYHSAAEERGLHFHLQADTPAPIQPDRQPLKQAIANLLDNTLAYTPGMGLGLSLVHAIVHAHGGQSGCENRPGGGAEFWLKLTTFEA
jgi:signal transduction histidine kinase